MARSPGRSASASLALSLGGHWCRPGSTSIDLHTLHISCFTYLTVADGTLARALRVRVSGLYWIWSLLSCMFLAWTVLYVSGLSYESLIRCSPLADLAVADGALARALCVRVSAPLTDAAHIRQSSR